MKKTFAFLSALLLLISLASCGAAPAQEEEKTDGSESRPAGEFSPAAAADDTLTPVPRRRKSASSMPPTPILFLWKT